MSLILDALSRAERDRRREEGPAPDLLVDHGPASRTTAPRRSRRLAALVALLVIAAVAAWLSTRAGPGGPEATGQAARSVQSEPALAPAPNARPPGGGAAPADADRRAPSGREDSQPATAADAPGVPLVPAAPPGEAGSRAEIARLYDERGDTVARADRGPGGDADVSTVDAPPSATRAAAAEPVPPGIGERAVERDEEPVDLEQVLRRVRAEAAAARLSDHPVPLLQTLTKQYRDRVPTLMYLRHDYNPLGSSTVLINGEALRVGGRTRGVEVREILADSVILRFEDREFRLRALNSWVNL